MQKDLVCRREGEGVLLDLFCAPIFGLLVLQVRLPRPRQKNRRHNLAERMVIGLMTRHLIKVMATVKDSTALLKSTRKNF